MTSNLFHEGGTSPSNALSQSLSDFSLSWLNCISFGCDNQRLSHDRPPQWRCSPDPEKESFCPHSGLPVSPLTPGCQERNHEIPPGLNIEEEGLIDLYYYYLENSSKRLKALEEHFQKESAKKILKYGCRCVALSAQQHPVSPRTVGGCAVFQREVGVKSGLVWVHDAKQSIGKDQCIFQEPSLQLVCSAPGLCHSSVYECKPAAPQWEDPVIHLIHHPQVGIYSNC